MGTDGQFRALCATLGCPALAQDEAFATNAARVGNRERLRAQLQERLRERPAGEWVAALSGAGVPAGQVNDIAGAFELAQRLGLAPIVEVARADGSAVRLTRNPIGLSATPVSYRTAPPALGEQSDAPAQDASPTDAAQRRRG